MEWFRSLRLYEGKAAPSGLLLDVTMDDIVLKTQDGQLFNSDGKQVRADEYGALARLYLLEE